MLCGGGRGQVSVPFRLTDLLSVSGSLPSLSFTSAIAWVLTRYGASHLN